MRRSPVRRRSHRVVAAATALVLVSAACADEQRSSGEDVPAITADSAAPAAALEVNGDAGAVPPTSTTLENTTTTTSTPDPGPSEPLAAEPAGGGEEQAPTTTIGEDPEHDPNPEPGAVPDDLVDNNLDHVASGGVAPTPLTGIAFESVASPQPDPVLQPVSTPSFVPVTLPDDPLPGGGGDLGFAAATGCADDCIADAVVTSAGGSSSRYDLRVDVENDATVEAYLSLAPIERNDDGGHVRPFSEPTDAGTVGFFWTTSFDLEPATEYHLLVRAIDEQGVSSVAGSFTTAEAMGPDQVMVPMPCADGCLEWVGTELDPSGTGISVEVRPDVDATLELAWSTEPFVQGDSGPTLDEPSINTVEAAAGSLVTLRLWELTPNTPYSFMITTTDSVGSTDRMVASVATPSPVIRAGVEWVHVRGDGDDGRFDRGEIEFVFGSLGGGDGSERWGRKYEEKIPSNTTIELGADAAQEIRADGAGEYPAIVVVAGERDGRSRFGCGLPGGPDGDWRPGLVTWCGDARTIWSSASVPNLTLAEIDQLDSCVWFEVDHPDADRCMGVHTPPNSSDQVSFDTVVWFDLP